MTSQVAPSSTVDEGLYDKAKRFIIGQVNPKLTKLFTLRESPPAHSEALPMRVDGKWKERRK